MRRVYAALVLALLSACHTPMTLTSIVEEGTRTTHTLRQEPHRAAVCVARNIDRRFPALGARIREGVAPALIEIHVSTDELVALARFFVPVSGAGSTATIWTARNRPDALVEEMVSGC